MSPDSNAIDRLAVARLRDGDVQALDVLYHRHAGALLQIAARLLGSRESGEDVVHDVFVSIVGAVSMLRDDSNVGAWLRTLTINRSIDRIRAAARHESLSPRATQPQGFADTRDIIASERIERAIAALPVSLRSVFVLHAIEESTHVEIAKTLGIRVGTSEVRYHRAIRALRAALGDLR